MDTFDYVVVGAGSAGCVVASRLSEDPGRKVLLIEAGPPPRHFWLKAPAGVGMMFHNKRYNWRFSTEEVPTLNVPQHGGRKVYWPRGKTLGGSSAINGMIYMRGHPLDFDHWASLGNPGWRWDEVLPYFIKSENNERGASNLHGGTGPMRVSDPVLRHPSTEDFVTAALKDGIPLLPELNHPPFEGISYQQFTIRDGRRESSYTAFIEPVRHRRNLKILTEATVLNIVLKDGRAVGVELRTGDGRQTITANREVILSAGALASPHLLNHSGIGDGTQLKALGIKTRIDLPGVGKNLQDHWFGHFRLRVTPESSYNSRLLGWRKPFEGLKYLLTHDGILALGSSAVSAYVKSAADQPQPDLQLVLRPMTFDFRPNGAVVIDPLPGVSGAAVVVRPKSIGHMHTVSPDPLEPPKFYPNYLADPDDVRRTLIGMKWMRRIFATEPLAKRIVSELAPGPDVVTDEQLTDYVKHYGATAWHQVGTCKMGPASDAMSVVDERLRVRGATGLRVVDASIMPRITAGNTHAPTVMIAEKACDMIKQDERA